LMSADPSGLCKRAELGFSAKSARGHRRQEFRLRARPAILARLHFHLPGFFKRA
jgi:hypothetical protein